MRLVIALVLALSACSEHGQGGAVVCRFNGENHFPGDFFSAGDSCNFCECVDEAGRGRVSCSTDDCGDGGLRDAGLEDAVAPPPDPTEPVDAGF